MNVMGVMPVNSLILTMSIPMMLSMMVQALYNIVDSIFVARISENALTAVSLAFPVQALIIGIAVGTGVGINALLSKSLGERDFEKVNKSAVNGLFLSWISAAVFLVAGVLFSESYFRTQTGIDEIIRYGDDYLSIICILSFTVFSQITLERLLSSTGKTFYTMISQMTGALVNIALDPVFIFGLFGVPKMGVKGAAIATVIGESCASLVALFFNLKKNKEIRLSFRKFRPDGGIIKSIYAVGIPSILMQCVGSFMIYGVNRILILFTSTANAVFGVFFRLQSFIFMPVFGMNSAIIPIIAFNYGARHKDRIIKTIKLSVLYAACIMLVGLLLFQLIPHKMLLLFNATPEMLEIGVPAFRIMSTIYIFAGFCIVCVSVLQAMGNAVQGLLVVSARQILVLLPAAWCLSLTGSLDAVWLAFPIAELASLAASIFFIKHLFVTKLNRL
ncbi:MAG: MATE family efflux transporter [Spirochaetaceae bacterium]|jgi:putative MATE family efflux protein|nr:MATE family efflux transporter [Spirochaetaceae bacterium]